jgi:1-pyrroline-5-carboxylate dehydrogenase
METELFGPVMTILFTKMLKTLGLLDASPYALTGAVFSQDRYAIEVATVKLQMLPVTSISMTNQQVLSWTTTIRWRKSVWNKRQSRFSIELIALGFTKNNQRNFCNSVDYRYPFWENSLLNTNWRYSTTYIKPTKLKLF